MISVNKKTLDFPIGSLFACMPFLAVLESKPFYQHVSIGDGYIGATNGPSMLIINNGAFEGCDYMLGGVSVCDFYQFVLGLPPETVINQFQLEIGEVDAMAVINGGEYNYPLELVKAPRTCLRKADIPKPDAVELKAVDMPYFNPDLLKDFIDAGQLYSSQPVAYIQILPTGSEKPIYIDMTPDMHGLLMPATLSGNLRAYSLHVDTLSA